MIMLEDSTRFQVASDVHSRRFEDELVILDLTRGEYYLLDPVGARIWEDFVEGRSLCEAVEKLAETYDTELSRLRKDTEILARDLLERGLIVTRV